MVDEETIKKIASHVSIMSWKEIRELGINMQTALKLRSGEIPMMRRKTVERLIKVLKIA